MATTSRTAELARPHAAAVRHRRLRRRRQVHARRPAAARLQVGPRRHARRRRAARQPRPGPGRRRPRAADRRPARRARAGHHDRRGLPLLRHRRSAGSSSPTAPGTCSTPATWSPAPPRPTRSCCSSTPATASSSRPAGTWPSPRCCGCRTWCSRSTRSTWSATPRSGSPRSPTSSRASPPSWACRDGAAIPVSALAGDNVVDRRAHMPWYDGPTLLELPRDRAAVDATTRRTSLPLPGAVRDPAAGRAARADAELPRLPRGTPARSPSGTLRVGDEVTVLPSRPHTTVVGIDTAGRAARGGGRAPVGDAAAGRRHRHLPRRPDRRRRAARTARGTRRPRALSWLGGPPLRPGARVLIKHGAAHRQGDGQRRSRPGWTWTDLELGHGRDARAQRHRRRWGSGSPRRCPLDPYAAHRRTGAFLVIDPQDGNTLAAGMVG